MGSSDPTTIEVTQLSISLVGEAGSLPVVVEPIYSYAPPSDGEQNSIGEPPAAVSEMSALPSEVGSPGTPPMATAGSAMGAEADGGPAIVPLDARFVVRAANVAPTNDFPQSPGIPARVLQKTRTEGSYLLDRGDVLIGQADITSARLYYQRAADAGDAQGALRLGETYDPAFLQLWVWVSAAEMRRSRQSGISEPLNSVHLRQAFFWRALRVK
jgi:hypothetical protein